MITPPSPSPSTQNLVHHSLMQTPSPCHSDHPAYIDKLNNDILYDVFSANAPWEYPLHPESNHTGLPLQTARLTSQVCRLWRALLLNSPSIWGRCIHLDELDQKTDEWRNLVLERTGTALLSVTSHHFMLCTNLRDGMTTSHHFNLCTAPEDGMMTSFFLTKLIAENFWRIARLDVKVHWLRLNNSAIRTLCQPTVNLQVFRLRDPDKTLWTFIMGFPHGLELFGNYAPSLSHLVIPQGIETRDIFKIARYSAGNLREFNIPTRIDISNIELLNICMHMPLLESLVLRLGTFTVLPEAQSVEIEFTNVASPSHTYISMPHLHEISIYSPTLDIYETFFHRIRPSEECYLVTHHHLHPSNLDPNNPTEAAKMGHMRRVLTRFVASSSRHRKRNESQNLHCLSSSEYTADLFYGFKFIVTMGRYFEVRITLCDDTGMPVVLFEHVQVIMSLLPLSELPDTDLKCLDLIGCQDWALDFQGRFRILPFLDLYTSMSSITHLRLNFRNLSHIAEQSQDQILFPALEMITFADTRPPADEDKNPILPKILGFILRRHGTTPTLILDLDPPMFLYSWPLGDLRLFDSVPAPYLTVRWRARDDVTMQCEYICGTGDRERLLLV